MHALLRLKQKLINYPDIEKRSNAIAKVRLCFQHF